jgi:hypothetical protein
MHAQSMFAARAALLNACCLLQPAACLLRLGTQAGLCGICKILWCTAAALTSTPAASKTCLRTKQPHVCCCWLLLQTFSQAFASAKEHLARSLLK